jgi:hypothetical protein
LARVDRATVEGEQLGSRSRRKECAAGLFELDPLDAVGGQDRNDAAVEFVRHGRLSRPGCPARNRRRRNRRSGRRGVDPARFVLALPDEPDLLARLESELASQGAPAISIDRSSTVVVSFKRGHG